VSEEVAWDWTLARRVRQAEEVWRRSDAALASLEELAEQAESDTHSGGEDEALIALTVTADIVAHLAGVFEVRRELLRQVRQDHGDDHPRADEAFARLLRAFRDLWIWDHAFKAAADAVEEALAVGQNPGNAAERAVIQAIRDGWPRMDAWLVAQALSEIVTGDMLAELAARLLVPRPGGDTGLYVRPSQKRALAEDATEQGVPLGTVLRDRLTGRCVAPSPRARRSPISRRSVPVRSGTSPREKGSLGRTTRPRA
jgi:hypothetical protein